MKNGELNGFRFYSYTLVLVGVFSLNAAVFAKVLTAPSITGGSTAFDVGWEQSNVFDGSPNVYASAGSGDAAFLEFDFGSDVQFDRVVMMNRISAAAGDRFTQVSLNYQDSGLTPTGSDTIATDARAGMSGVYSLASRATAQHVRWDVDTRNGTAAPNVGMMEMIFLDTPDGAGIVSGVTAFNGATAYGPDLSFAKSVDAFVGGDGTDYVAEYASQGLGTGMFLDFDLGVATQIVGFDYIDRMYTSDRVEKFDLIFSNDSDFSTVVDTLSFDKGSDAAYSAEFADISARYVRLDATQVYSGAGATYNSGVNEMVFYAIPEPSTLVMVGLFGLGFVAIRRLQV